MDNNEYRAGLVRRFFPEGCIYCGSPVVFTDSKFLYGKSYGMFYICSNTKCQAHVGCHKEGEFKDQPLGRLADGELRHWKQEAHAAFDQLWKGKSRIMTRKEAYAIAAKMMEIDVDFMHIGNFNVQQCQQLIQKLKENELISAAK